MLTIAFLLNVEVDNEIVSDPRMLWRSIYNCQEYASAIEMGKWSRNDRPHYRQEKVTAYCVPKMVDKKTVLFE